MKLQVRALGGIERADIEIDKVALLVGQTGAGKTSIAEAARSAITNDWHIRGVTQKARLGAVVHSGYESGAVRLSEGEKYAQMKFPGGEYETAGGGTGTALWSGEVACGLVNPLAADVKARAQFFIEILAASPTKQNLVDALTDTGLEENQALKVWERIEASNWDDAQKHYATRATEMKGQWETFSHDRWGKRKGEDFVPEGWDETLTGKSEQSLGKSVTARQESLEKLIAKSAVSAEHLAKLKEDAGKLESLKKQLFRVDQLLSKAKLAAQEQEDALKALPEPEKEPKTVDCPHCGAECMVDVSSGDFELLAEIKGVSEKENAARTAALEDARKALAAARQEVKDCDGQAAQCERLVKTAEAATKELEGVSDAGEDNTAAIETAREAVATAERRLAMFLTKRKADIAHRSVMLNAAVADELKPEGLRKRRLQDALKEFNDVRMAKMSKMVPGIKCYFDPGTLDPMMETDRGSRAYRMLSRGEKLIFQACLQFAVAEMDNSSLVIVDDADAVQGDLRSGLVKMALAAKTPSIIAMAVRAPNQVPDLGAMKGSKGRTYWIADKTAVDVSDMEK